MTPSIVGQHGEGVEVCGLVQLVSGRNFGRTISADAVQDLFADLLDVFGELPAHSLQVLRSSARQARHGVGEGYGKQVAPGRLPRVAGNLRGPRLAFQADNLRNQRDVHLGNPEYGPVVVTVSESFQAIARSSGLWTIRFKLSGFVIVAGATLARPRYSGGGLFVSG
jgi:hypothetical protein